MKRKGRTPHVGYGTHKRRGRQKFARHTPTYSGSRRRGRSRRAGSSSIIHASQKLPSRSDARSILSARADYKLPSRRAYARFYGKFKYRGKVRFFEYQVKASERLNNKALAQLIAQTAVRMKYDHQMPIHKRHETLSSFKELHRRPWIHITAILDYDVEMDYPTPFD